MQRKSYRILQLNSLLSGGGTDDQCVKLAQGLLGLGQEVSIAGPNRRQYTAFILSAAKLLRKLKVEIVHGHHGRDIWPTLLAVKLSGKRPKIVFTRHMAKSPGSALSRQTLLRQCDALIAVSQFTKDVLSQGHHDPHSPERERHRRPPIRGDYAKIKVAYGGIDTDRFVPGDATALRKEWGLRAGDYAFAVAGGYDFPRGKGQREFLKAAAKIHSQFPQARFLIIGRGNMEQLLKSDIANLGLLGKAWLTPYCEDMVAAMNAIDCLVHPQIGTESFGLVLLEAFACGKPVIASDLDGIPEAFAATGYGNLVRPESIPELSHAMSEWAVRPGLDEKSRLLMHEKITAKFSVEQYARRVLAIYGDLFKPKR